MFVAGETLLRTPDSTWSVRLHSRVLPNASPDEDSRKNQTLPPAPQALLLIGAEDSLRRRLLPYAIAGAVVGGIVGYAAHEGVFWDRKACDGDLNPLCPLTPYVYVIIGVTAGTWTGMLVGYLRHRR